MLVDGLKHNLLSISQLCDRNFNITFKSNLCYVSCSTTNDTIFNGLRNGNVYIVDLDNLCMNKMQFLVVNNLNESSWLDMGNGPCRAGHGLGPTGQAWPRPDGPDHCS